MANFIDSRRGESSRLTNTETLTELHPALWRAHQLGTYKGDYTGSGFASLNAQLPSGGWPHSNLIELLLKNKGIGELRFLIPTLRQLVLEGKHLVLMNPPYLPAPLVWEQFGIDHQRLICVQTPKPQDKLWAMEKLLQSDAFGALIMWLPEGVFGQHTHSAHAPLLQTSQLRRLQVQAQRSRGLCFALRPLHAQDQASPAVLRLTLQAHSPGHLKVRVIKRRGPVMDEPLLITLPGAPSDWCQNPLATGVLWQAQGLLGGHPPVPLEQGGKMIADLDPYSDSQEQYCEMDFNTLRHTGAVTATSRAR